MVAVQNRMQGGMMLRSSQQGSFHSLTRGMSGHFQGNLMLAGGQKMARSGSVCSAGQAHTLGLQGQDWPAIGASQPALGLLASRESYTHSSHLHLTTNSSCQQPACCAE